MSSEVQISSHNSHDKFVELSLDELLTRKNQGVNTTTEKVSYSEIGIPVIRANNILNGVIDYKDIVYVDEDTFARIKEPCKPRSGDILYTNIGSQFGNAAKVEADFEFAIAWNVMRLQPRNDIDSDFLMYLLNNPETKTYIRSLNSSSTMPFVSGKEIGKVKLKVPPIGTQRSISFILRAIDDRIALLRETNATLEAIAQALFKSWFVDFDPVHANAGTQAPSLPPEIQALFPATFTDSPQGPIPEGWSTCPLDGAAHFLNGLALQKFPPTGDEFLPVIKIAQLRKGDTSGADRANRDLKPEYIIQNGDVLFSWSGSLEVAIWCGGEGALNQHLFKVTSDKFPKWFYFLWTKYHLPNFQQIAASKATTMGHIQRKHLTEASVMIPPDNVLSAANEVFAPLIEEFINNSLQASNLAALRDALLPRLISGQLRLPEVEQAVAAIPD